MFMFGILLGAATSLERPWWDEDTAVLNCGIALEDATGPRIEEVSVALEPVATLTAETFCESAAAELAGMALGGRLVLSGRRGGAAIAGKSRVWPIRISGFPKEVVTGAAVENAGVSRSVWIVCFWWFDS